MTFPAFLEQAHQAINDHEAELASLWSERLRELEEREANLRNALLAVLLLWDFDARGRLRRRGPGAREALRAIRRRAEAAVDQFEAGLLESFTGSPRGWRDVPDLGGPDYFKATRHEHIYRAAFRAQSGASSMSEVLLLEARQRIEGRRLLEDRSRPGPGPEGPAPTETPPPAMRRPDPTRREVRTEIERALDSFFGQEDPPAAPGANDWPDVEVDFTAMQTKEEEERARKLHKVNELFDMLYPDYFEDARDALDGALDNPEGNIRNRSRQIREKIRDLAADPTTTRAAVIGEINGTRRANAYRAAASLPAGVQLNRGHMALSVATHARAAFRAVMLHYGRRAGIRNYVLEYPVTRRADLSRGGVLGQHVHQVRSLDDWAATYSDAGLSRFSTGTTVLGFHPGDFGYLIPVPAHYLEAAREYSRRARGRLAAFFDRRDAA